MWGVDVRCGVWTLGVGYGVWTLGVGWTATTTTATATEEFPKPSRSHPNVPRDRISRKAIYSLRSNLILDVWVIWPLIWKIVPNTSNLPRTPF